MVKKLLILCTHPIQYYTPIWKGLAECKGFETRVIYTKHDRKSSFDSGFNQNVEWDIDLHSGYNSAFVPASGVRGKLNLIKFLTAEAPTAVMVVGWNPSGHLLGMVWAKFFSRCWFRGDSHCLDESRSLRTALRRCWLTIIYKCVDVAFCVGRANREYFQKHGIADRRIILAPHAIDVARFRNAAAEFTRVECREKLEIATTEFLVGFLGKFERKKNPMGVVRSFREVKVPGVNLIMVGAGDLEKNVRSLAKDDKRIELRGFQNQSMMPLFLKACNVVVLTSTHDETWGLIINESLAVGTPCIVGDRVGCQQDILLEAPNTIVVPSGNDKALTAAIALAKSREGIDEKLISECLNASTRFSIQNVVAAVEAQMNKVA